VGATVIELLDFEAGVLVFCRHSFVQSGHGMPAKAPIIAVGQPSFQTCAAFCLLAQQMDGRAILQTSTPSRARVGC